MTSIQALGEKAIIRTLIRPLLDHGATSEVGIGDDAAVLQLTESLSLVLTVDHIPERLIAYQHGVMNEKHLGAYLVAVNLSDLAAMGAEPTCMLLSLTMPSSYELDKLRNLLEGVRELASRFSIPVVGGDTKEGSAVSFVGVAAGLIPPGKSLRRSGARPGDRILITGTPGVFGAGLAYLLVAQPRGLNLPQKQRDDLFSKFLDPTPRVQEGLLLRELGCVHACQDISDGVAQTLTELAESSGIGFVVDALALQHAAPVAAERIAEACSTGVETILLGPGADLELAFAVAPTDVQQVRSAFQSRGWPLHDIGAFTEEGYKLRMPDGECLPVPRGYQHFTGQEDGAAISSVYLRT